jgi:hypothetical protein
VVVPVAYTYLDNLGKRAARWLKGAPQGHAADAEKVVLVEPA